MYANFITFSGRTSARKFCRNEGKKWTNESLIIQSLRNQCYECPAEPSSAFETLLGSTSFILEASDTSFRHPFELAVHICLSVELWVPVHNLFDKKVLSGCVGQVYGEIFCSLTCSKAHKSPLGHARSLRPIVFLCRTLFLNGTSMFLLLLHTY